MPLLLVLLAAVGLVAAVVVPMFLTTTTLAWLERMVCIRPPSACTVYIRA